MAEEAEGLGGVVWIVKAEGSQRDFDGAEDDDGIEGDENQADECPAERGTICARGAMSVHRLKGADAGCPPGGEEAGAQSAQERAAAGEEHAGDVEDDAGREEFIEL